MKFSFAIVAVLSLALSSFDFASAADKIKPIEPSPFCKHHTLAIADGTQIPEGYCVSLVIGEVPSVDNMVSALIISPDYNQKVKQHTSFTVKTKLVNLDTGFFSDPAVDYYQIPQTLKNGIIQGHSHITIQKLDGNMVPDPKKIAFFKGLNGMADKDGILSVEVEKGLPEKGTYRICTMNSSNSHQPVVMPVAARGSQDDCIRIRVY
jgi:hypothetical protein